MDKIKEAWNKFVEALQGDPQFVLALKAFFRAIWKWATTVGPLKDDSPFVEVEEDAE